MSDGMEATTYVHYWWDCPACGNPNDAGDIEPAGLETCDECGEEVRVK